jgi:flavin-dependent dehydrogenase
MAKKIIVAGGGHGGIGAAALLANAGFDVTVYEKNSRENMGYDWTDIFDYRGLEDIGLSKPENIKEIHQMSFLPPSRHSVIRLPLVEGASDIKMERKDIYDLIIKNAEDAGAKFVYDCAVEGPLMAGDRVIGIKTSKGEFTADMVIDACGCESPVRKGLPACCGIKPDMEKFEKFYVYRAFFNRAADVADEDRYKVYMVPNGIFGIAWVAVEDDTADILIGEFDPLDDAKVAERMEFFRKDNPALGTELKRGGQYTEIPVRQTLSVMVADGYAAIGDSAYMTIPLIGSGIANSFHAAKILADTIIGDVTETYSAETLWNYQLRYHKEVGAGLSSLALVKLLLAKLTPDQIDYLFDSRVITANELTISGDSTSVFDVNPELIKKGAAIVKEPKIAGQFVKLGASIAALTAINAAIPRNYGRYTVTSWAKRYDDIFKTK